LKDGKTETEHYESEAKVEEKDRGWPNAS